MTKVSVICTGYVGLVTGACLADVGNEVLCVDMDSRKIERLCRFEIRIHVPGLEAVVHRSVAAHRLGFTTDSAEALRHSGLIFIVVGTPSSEAGSAHLSHVLACARSLGRALNRGTLVVLKSTVPVGTNQSVMQAVSEEVAARGHGLAVWTVSNPEFLKEGFAVEDVLKPDPIVIGIHDPDARERLRQFNAPLNRNPDLRVVMNIRCAEFTKYSVNGMLALRTCFISELANVAERVGADIE